MIRVRAGRLSSCAVSTALIAALGAALAGCNAQSEPVASAPAAAAPAANSSEPQAAPVVSLPFGSACAAAIQKWRSVIQSDYTAGYSDASVYRSVQKDIATEQSTCAAGSDGQAVQMVRDSRRRHGYPLD